MNYRVVFLQKRWAQLSGLTTRIRGEIVRCRLPWKHTFLKSVVQLNGVFPEPLRRGSGGLNPLGSESSILNPLDLVRERPDLPPLGLDSPWLNPPSDWPPWIWTPGKTLQLNDNCRGGMSKDCESHTQCYFGRLKILGEKLTFLFRRKLAAEASGVSYEEFRKKNARNNAGHSNQTERSVGLYDRYVFVFCNIFQS